jgi:LacI family transcriptional regulator
MRGKKALTLTDVARRAGVSRTTASYILNGRADQMRIAPETVLRVQHVVDELGYRRNRSAQNLRTSTTRTIGLLSDHVASGHYANSMLIGASIAARRSDHLMVIGESQGDRELEDQLIQDMLERQVDGFAYMRLVTSRVTVPEPLRDQNLVLVNCVDEHGAFPAILPDERAGGWTAADVLVDSGIEGDVYVIGEDPTPDAMAGPLRLAGITERLEEAGWPLAGVVPCPWDVRETHDAVHHWLMSGVQPAALICLNDRVAMGTYQALAKHGLDVPSDVSVVSFDGSELATWLRPPVVSVAVPYEAIGERAIDELTSSPAPSAGTRWVSMPQSSGLSVRGRA